MPDFAPRHRSATLLGLLLALNAAGAFADPAPLRFEDMDGNAFDAEAIANDGKPVVFVFWQTWCPSCKKEAPQLTHAVEQFGGRIHFFGVVSGPDGDIDDADVRRTATAWGYSHAQVRDRDLALATRFRVTGTPVIVVVGRGGRVLYRGYRLPEDWSVFLEANSSAEAG